MKEVKFLKQVAGNKIGSTMALDSALVDQLLAKGWVEVVGEAKAPSTPEKPTTKKVIKKSKSRKRITTVPKKK